MGSWPEGLLESLGALPDEGETLLVIGASGRGKSTLSGDLAGFLARGRREVRVLAADPGQPCWGPPASVCEVGFELGAGGEPVPRMMALACVGSLDPVRHQATYLAGLLRLRRGIPPSVVVVVDAPGVVRGPVAVEFTDALLAALEPAAVAAFAGGEVDPLLSYLEQRPGLEVVSLKAAAEARRPGRNERRRLRTAAWERYLEGASELKLQAGQFHTRGAPRPGLREGSLVGLLAADGETLAMGEVVEVTRVTELEAPTRLGASVTVLAPRVEAARIHTLLAVDAQRDAQRQVMTARRAPSKPPKAPTAWGFPARQRVPVPIGWPIAAGRAPYQPRLLNSATGDPALMLRQKRTGRALLFDLGWLEPLPTKVLHAVTDLFVSHAHMDHLQGLVTLLRVLLGPGGTLRLYGPPRLDEQVVALVSAFDFDLVGDGGPTLIVHTLSGEQLEITSVRCANPVHVETVGRRAAPGGLVLEEPGLVVRAVTLTHSVPVLAYRCGIRDTRRPAPKSPIPPPRRFSLAYVVDADDTAKNRARILDAANGADLFVCEARFMEEHRERARETRHLTARACAELARDAGVGLLVPFHFSPRYEDRLDQVYREILSVFDRVIPAVISRLR